MGGAMAVTKQWRCAAHGEFEGPDGACPAGCPAAFVKQEIRTAPAFRRSAPGGGSRMAFIDGTLRQIADDFKLPDLKADPKANVSVIEAVRKSNNVEAPRWMDIPHASPGFSRSGEKAPPVALPGFEPSAATRLPSLPSNTVITGRHRS